MKERNGVMKVYDVSMEISYDMAVYKDRDENRPVLSTDYHHGNSDKQESSISMNLHTGTHLDAPIHMIKEGITIEKLPIEDFIGACKVLDLTQVEGAIDREDLEEKTFTGESFILLKTRNSMTERFDFDYIYLSESGAGYLKEMGVKGVGIDALGIERNQPDHETHRTLMDEGIYILEGLRLGEVGEGIYTLVALPLKIKGGDGSPVRAILIG